jgi:hypothetical protein
MIFLCCASSTHRTHSADDMNRKTTVNDSRFLKHKYGAVLPHPVRNGKEDFAVAGRRFGNG